MLKEHERPIELWCTSLHLDGFTYGQVYYSYKYDIENGLFKVYSDSDEIYFLSQKYITDHFNMIFPNGE